MKRARILSDKTGQVWIETVIYTLIGLSLIGIVLAIVTPKINEFRDRSVIEQTIDSLHVLDGKITETLSAPGNVRKVTFRMKRGTLSFDTAQNQIRYVLDDSRSLFSEPGISIPLGKVNVTTTEGSKRHSVELLLTYSHNITFEGIDDQTIEFTQTSIPYEFAIENKDFVTPGVIQIDIREIS